MIQLPVQASIMAGEAIGIDPGGSKSPTGFFKKIWGGIKKGAGKLAEGIGNLVTGKTNEERQAAKAQRRLEKLGKILPGDSIYAPYATPSPTYVEEGKVDVLALAQKYWWVIAIVLIVLFLMYGKKRATRTYRRRRSNPGTTTKKRSSGSGTTSSKKKGATRAKVGGKKAWARKMYLAKCRKHGKTPVPLSQWGK